MVGTLYQTSIVVPILKPLWTNPHDSGAPPCRETVPPLRKGKGTLEKWQGSSYNITSSWMNALNRATWEPLTEQVKTCQNHIPQTTRSWLTTWAPKAWFLSWSHLSSVAQATKLTTIFWAARAVSLEERNAHFSNMITIVGDFLAYYMLWIFKVGVNLDAWNGVRLEGTVLRSWCGTMVRFWGHGTVQWYGSVVRFWGHGTI